mmetsp:Transcript_22254/g.63102  ORF Transcript_22254/g.63102 Transcript_22254/m.63102 type:complete len:357 (+) Transcript_22254:90-1160(+)
MTMTELMKEGCGIVKAEQRSSARFGKIVVVANNRDSFHLVDARCKIFRLRSEFGHPCPAAFEGAGVVVVEENCDKLTVLSNFEDVHIRMVGLDIFARDVFQAEELVGHIEHGCPNSIKTQVRLEHAFVEVVFFLSDLFGNEPPVPRLDRCAVAQIQLVLLDVCFQSFALFVGRHLCSFPHVLQQLHHGLGSFGHPVNALVRRKRGVSVQRRLSLAQLQDLLADGNVVAFGTELATVRPCFPGLLAQCAIGAVHEEWLHQRSAQCDDVFIVSRLVALRCSLLGRFNQRGRAALQILGGHHHLVRGLVLHDVLLELRRQCGEFRLDRCVLFLLFAIEVSPRTLEVHVDAFHQPQLFRV